MIFCLPASKLRLRTAAVALALSVSVAIASDQVDSSRWLVADGDHGNDQNGFGPRSLQLLENQHGVRGIGVAVTVSQNVATFRNEICNDEIFSMFCDAVNSFTGIEETQVSVPGNIVFVDFDLNVNEEFTLFAPANSAFTLDGNQLRVTLPGGLLVEDFLNNHIIDGETLTMEDLSMRCSEEIPTKMAGQTTRTVCDSLTKTPLWQSGRGNIGDDRPFFIGGKYMNKRVGLGIVHAINGFIKPKNFVPSESPSSMPSVSMAPSGMPSATPSNAPSVSVAPSAMPSETPSAAPSTSPSDMPSSMPSIMPSDRPSDVPSETPSDVPSAMPSATPSVSVAPSTAPSNTPSTSPSDVPSTSPSETPSDMPSTSPSAAPSDTPSTAPSTAPSDTPSTSPSIAPSDMPSTSPSIMPSSIPSATPSEVPSNMPSVMPSAMPSPSAVKSINIDSLNSGGNIDPERLPTDKPSTSDPTWSPTTWFPTISNFPTINFNKAGEDNMARGGIVEEASISETTIETPSERPSDGPSLMNSGIPSGSLMPSPPLSRRQTKRERQREKRRQRRERLAMLAAANQTSTKVDSAPVEGEVVENEGGDE